jgi:hypothetical protein
MMVDDDDDDDDDDDVFSYYVIFSCSRTVQYSTTKMIYYCLRDFLHNHNHNHLL